jgi:drug/metabolite transporter (DMT)-like permease
MTNILLFAATVLIWGTTWIAIAFQVGDIPLVTSVFYRFALAAIVMIAGLVLMGKLKWPSTWRFIFAQAVCLFCFNFIAFYNATALMPSGLVSVIFSLATIFNAINARLLFKDPIQRKTILAGAIGVTGLALLFWRDLTGEIDVNVLLGVAWATGGTMLFSLGNMASRRNSAEGITPIQANAWGMGIGSMVLLAIIFITQTPIIVPTSGLYIGALVYLAVIGSVVGFTTYLMMVARMGASQAAYATVLFPVVALLASTLFEGYQWHWTAFLGLGLTMIGNLVMFGKWPKKSPALRQGL